MLRKVTLAVLALLLATLSGCALDVSGSRTITARMALATGIYVGNDVTVLGLKVGSITDIAPAGDHVDVRLRVSSDIKIPADVQAVAISPSVVTDRHIELVPAYTGGAAMGDGGVIPLARTHVPVEFDQVVAAARQLADALDRQGGEAPVKDLLDATSGLVANNGLKFRKLLDNLSSSVGTAGDSEPQLVQLVQGADQLMATAAANDARIRAFSTNLTAATQTFAAGAPQLDTALTQSLLLLRSADDILTANDPALREVIANLDTTVKTVAGRKREVAETADLLPLLFQNLAGAIDPQSGYGRVHVLGFQSVLQTELVKYLCPYIPILPACTGGGTPAASSVASVLGGLL